MPKPHWTSRTIPTADAAMDPNEECRVTRPRTHAFTTIELLITLSILVILAGLVFVGFKVVGNGGKTRATRNTLETTKSLLTEVDVAKGLPYVKRMYSSPPNNAKSYYFAFPPLPTATPSSAPAGTPNPPVPTPIDAPVDASKNGNMDEDAFALGLHEIRFKDPAVIRTQMVMSRIQSLSANRTIVGQLPAKTFLAFPTAPLPGTVGNALQYQVTQVGPPTKYAFNPPVLVDSWGNPIIYVPAAGMRGVYYKDNPTVERLITSVRVRSPYGTNASDPLDKKFDAGATGFWASAGADGDFTKGDDNTYSFEGF